MDSRIFSFLIKGWMKENPDEFDFILAFRIYTSLKTRLATLLDVRNPTASPRRVRYGRDLDKAQRGVALGRTFDLSEVP